MEGGASFKPGSRRCQFGSPGCPVGEVDLCSCPVESVSSDSDRPDDPAGGWLPGERELDQGQSGDPSEEKPIRKEWRVTVRLRHGQYEQLSVAAELYGVRPTTMARMLINRGANAIVNAYRRDELGFGRTREG